MRVNSRFNSTARTLLLLCLTIAVFIAAVFSYCLATNVSVAEEGEKPAFLSTFEYSGDTSPDVDLDKVVYTSGTSTYEYAPGEFPASLGAYSDRNATMFSGYLLDNKKVAEFSSVDGLNVLTVTDPAIFGSEGTAVLNLDPQFVAIDYVIEYNLNAPEGSEGVSNPNAAVAYNADKDGEIQLKPAVCNGQTFKGWSMECGDGTSIDNVTKIDRTVVSKLDEGVRTIRLNATWESATYTLTINYNNGDPTWQTNVGYGVSLREIIGSVIPQSPAGVFVGWQADGKLIDLDTATMPARNYTLVAYYAEPSVNVVVTLVFEEEEGIASTIVSLGMPAGTYTAAEVDARASSQLAKVGHTYTLVWDDEQADPSGERTLTEGSSYKMKASYVRKTYQVIVSYKYLYDDSEAHAQTTQEVKYGERYVIKTPAIDGYSPDKAEVSGVMGAANVVQTVTYESTVRNAQFSGSGIEMYVTNSDGGLHGASVSAAWSGSGADSYTATLESKGYNLTAYGVVEFTVEGAKYGERGNYTVRLKINDENLKNTAYYNIFIINDDGTLSHVSAGGENGSIVFKTDGSGKFLVAGSYVVPMWMKYAGIGIAGLLLLLIIIIIILLIVLRKKSVKFEVNGGEKIKKVKVKKGGIVELPVPVQEGMTFAGWYTDKDCTKPVELVPEEEVAAMEEDDKDKKKGKKAKNVKAKTAKRVEYTEPESTEDFDDGKVPDEMSFEAPEGAPEQEPLENYTVAEEELRIYDEPGGNDVTDEESGGGDTFNESAEEDKIEKASGKKKKGKKSKKAEETSENNMQDETQEQDFAAEQNLQEDMQEANAAEQNDETQEPAPAENAKMFVKVKKSMKLYAKWIPVEQPEPVAEEPAEEPVEEEPVAEPVVEEPVQEPVVEEPVEEPQEQDDDVMVAAAVLPEEDEDEGEEEPEEEEDTTPEIEESEDDNDETVAEEPDEADGAPHIITVTDAIKRRSSTMRGRLRYGSDVNKAIYEDLVNYILEYKNINRTLTNKSDNYKFKGNIVAKITLTGKTIKLYLPLDAEAYDYDKYHQMITVNKPGFETVPFTVKVKSARGLRYAQELIDEAMALVGIERKKRAGDRKSFKELILLQKGSLLIKAKKTDLLRSRVDTQDANAKLTDTEAQTLIRNKAVAPLQEEKKLATVSLEKINELYNDCDIVNFKTLSKRGLIPEECDGVKIIGGGTLTKSLKVFADEYSLTAVKMIVLLGGKVTKYVPEENL